MTVSSSQHLYGAGCHCQVRTFPKTFYQKLSSYRLKYLYTKFLGPDHVQMTKVKPLKTTFSDKILKNFHQGVTLFRSPRLFWFFAPNCKQTALSLEIRMVDKFCLHIFSSHEVPQLWGEFEFLRCRDCPTYSCISS